MLCRELGGLMMKDGTAQKRDNMNLLMTRKCMYDNMTYMTYLPHVEYA